MQAVGLCKGQPCLLVARFLYRHAHSSKVRACLPYRNFSSDLQLANKLKVQRPHVLLQVSSQLEENQQQNDAGTKVVKVKFVLQKRCEFGQQYSVTGDGTPFGAWDPEAAIPMQWSEGHIWTAELDLSVGTCVEFKVVRMAEQELLEWQPGPNRKLELSGALPSLVVSVPWSDEEDSLKIEVHDDVEETESLGPQDGKEMASFGSLSDLAEDKESGTIKSVNATEEQMIEEGSTDSETIKGNAMDCPDELLTEVNEIAAGDKGAIDARISINSDLTAEKVTLSFAIPESWYSEEYNPRRDLSGSHDSIESSPVSAQDIAEGELMSSALKPNSNDKEEEHEENLMSLNRPDGVISEGTASSMILTTELEPSKPSATTEKEELRILDVRVEATSSQRKQEMLLSDAELEEENSKNNLIQNGPDEVSSEDSSETMMSATVSDSEDHSDEEVVASNGSSLVIDKVPEDEIPSTTTDSLEDVEEKSSVTKREKRRIHKGWSKLWGAFIYGPRS